MKSILPVAVFLCTALFASQSLQASWGASCGPVGSAAAFSFAPSPPMSIAPPVSVAVAPSYEWKQYNPVDPELMYLWDAAASKQVGVWKFTDHTYHQLLADPKTVPDPFSGPVHPPIPPPLDAVVVAPQPDAPKLCICSKCGAVCRCSVQDQCQLPPLVGASVDKDGVINYGLNREKLESNVEKYQLNGAPVTAKQAVTAIITADDPKLPDDTKRPSATAIGTPEQCAKVHDDLVKAGLIDSVVWQDYRPDDVMVAKFGFVTKGAPSVYLQAIDGKVLYREDVYDPTRFITAVRKADPLYDPTKDPNGSSPLTAPFNIQPIIDYVKTVPPVVWIVGAGAGLFMLYRRNKKA